MPLPRLGADAGARRARERCRDAHLFRSCDSGGSPRSTCSTTANTAIRTRARAMARPDRAPSTRPPAPSGAIPSARCSAPRRSAGSTMRSPRAGKGWNVVGMQTLFGQRDFKAGPGESFWNDGWDGYPAARGRLIASIAQAATLANPVLLGGDVHQNWVGHVKADYADPCERRDRRRVLRNQHHGALRRQRPCSGVAGGEPALRVRRRRRAEAMASSSSRRTRLTASLRVVGRRRRGATRRSTRWRDSRSGRAAP